MNTISKEDQDLVKQIIDLHHTKIVPHGGVLASDFALPLASPKLQLAQKVRELVHRLKEDGSKTQEVLNYMKKLDADYAWHFESHLKTQL